jgi:hypothetical protein
VSACVLRCRESEQMVNPVQVFSSLIAFRWTPSLCLLVSDHMLRYSLHNRKGVNSSWLGCVGSLMTAPEWSKALHLSARGITTDPGSIPGCITTGPDQESQMVVHNWPRVVGVRGGFGRGRPG